MAHLKPTENQSLKAKSARSPETKPCIQHATSLSDDSAALLRLLESEQFRAPRSPQQGNLFRPRGEVSSAPSSPRPTLQLTAARSSLNRSSVPALDLTKLKASSSDRQSEESSRGLHRSQSCQSIPSFAISHSKQATELDIMRQLQGDTRPRRDAALPVMGWYPPQDDIGHGGVPELRKPPKYMENPVSERRTTTPRAFYPDAVHEPLGKSISRRRAGSLPSTMTGQEAPINEGFSRVRNFCATELGETTRDMIRPFYSLVMNFPILLCASCQWLLVLHDPQLLPDCFLIADTHYYTMLPEGGGLGAGNAQGADNGDLAIRRKTQG